METDRNEISTRILNITLEIICLVTGEDYTVVKKTSGDCVAPSSYEPGGWIRGPITEPPPRSPIHERQNKLKILALTHKMLELLTGEVTVLTGEEWEYVERHKDMYEDIMMEDHQRLISEDGRIDRNPPERSPSPLYSQDSPEEKHNVSEDHQGEDLINIKVVDEAEEEKLRSDHLSMREVKMRSDQLCMREVKEERQGDVTPENPSEGNFMLSLNYEVEEDENMMQPSSEETFTTIAHNAFLSKNRARRKKELPVELRDSIVKRHKSGEGYRKISAALKVPKSTVANVIYKWRKFGTTRTLPRAGRPTKLSNQGQKGLRKRGDQEPDGHSD